MLEKATCLKITQSNAASINIAAPGDGGVKI